MATYSTNDYSPNGNNLTAVSTTSSTNVPYPSLDFSTNFGGSSYLSAAYSSTISNFTQISLEGWYYFTTLASESGNQIVMVNKAGTNGGLQSSYMVRAWPGGSGYPTDGIWFIYWDASSNNTSFYTTSYAVPKNTWVHLAITVDAAAQTCQMYVNGSAVAVTQGSAGATTINATTNDLWFGDYQVGGLSFLGNMADIRIWNTVRSASEVSSNYNQRLAGSETGLMGYFPMSDPPAPIPVDKFSDNFNRADSASLGSPWVDVSGDFQIVSNQAKSVGGVSIVTDQTTLSTADNQMSISMQFSTSAPLYSTQMILRATGPNIFDNCYYLNVQNYGDSTVGLQLYKRVSGTPTTLGSEVRTTLVNGTYYTYKFIIRNDWLTGYINGVAKVFATDSTYTAAGSHGLRAAQDTIIDDYAVLNVTDGKYTVRSDSSGKVATSTNFGKTWVTENPKGDGLNYYWASTAINNDGSVIAAATNRTVSPVDGKVYIKRDGFWAVRSPVPGDNQWNTVSMSGDGKHILAARYTNDYAVYISHNYGQTWSAISGSYGLLSVFSSAMNRDGTKFMIGCETGRLYYCSNGSTLVEMQPKGNLNGNWYNCTMSFDGQRLMAADSSGSNGRVYYSDNAGSTWTAQSLNGGAAGYYGDVSMSDDGSLRQAGGQFGARAWLYADGTWTQQFPGGLNDYNWTSASTDYYGSIFHWAAAHGTSGLTAIRPGTTWITQGGAAYWTSMNFSRDDGNFPVLKNKVITAMARIQKLGVSKTLNAKARVKYTGVNKTVTAKAKVIFDYRAGYTQHLNISADYTKVFGSTHTDFTVPVRGTFPSIRTTAYGGYVTNANGYDIIFTSTDYQVRYQHQIEYWNPATGEAVFWVKIPSLSNVANTNFQMWFGNSSISTPQASTAAWDANHKGVYLHNTDPSGGIIDYTAAPANMTSSGGMNSANLVNGNYGKATNFVAASSQYGVTALSVSKLDFSGATDYTVESWINLASYNAVTDVFPIWKGDGATYIQYSLGITQAGRARMRSGPAGGDMTTDVTDIVPLASWHHVAIVRQSGVGSIYIDGELKKTGTSFPNMSSSTLEVWTGYNDYAPNQIYLNGKVGEVRLSSSARSAGWLKTEYVAGNDPTFLTVTNESFGAKEGYSHYVNIAIDYTKVISSTHTNFTVPVKGNFPYLKTVANGGHVENANGYDIIFTSPDGVTKYSHEVASWNGITGDAIFWVKIPSLSNTVNTNFRMYYGNPNIALPTQSTDAWASDYKAVYHMQDAAGTISDSTNNGKNMFPVNAPSYGQAGKIGKSIQFNGSNNLFYIPAIFGPGTDEVSMSAWINAFALAAAPRIVVHHGDNVSINIDFSLPGTILGQILNTTGSWKGISATGKTNNTWYKVTVTGKQNNFINVYIDGVSAGAAVASNTWADPGTNYPASIGAYKEVVLGELYYFSGRVEEVRYSNSVKSAGWVQTEYNAESDPAFMSLSGEHIPINKTVTAKAHIHNFVGSQYDHYLKLNVDHTKVWDTDHTNFPVLVSGTQPFLKSVANGGHVENANGYDIIFSTADGLYRLDHEVEKYNPATGEYVIWVRIPTLSTSVDTEFRMYYGNPDISSPTQNAPGVWDANHKAVWHMNSNNDSTVNGNTLGNNGVPYTLPGEIGFGADYNDATPSYNTVTHNASNTINGAITVELWTKRDRLTNLEGIIHNQDQNFSGYATRKWEMGWIPGAGGAGTYAFIWDICDGASISNIIDIRDEAQPVIGTWYHYVGTWDGTTGAGGVKLYKNGVLVGSKAAPFTSTLVNTHAIKFAGAGDGGASYYYNGMLDEVRLSNTNRSGGWIKTEYYNATDPNFIVYSGEHISVNKTVTAKARILHADITKTVSAKARVKYTGVAKLISAKANIKPAGGLSRIFGDEGLIYKH